jgi:hypothetical protein
VQPFGVERAPRGEDRQLHAAVAAERRLPAQQRAVHVVRTASAGRRRQVGEQHAGVDPGQEHPRRGGRQPFQHGVGPGELPRVRGARVHDHVGELGLPDGDLSHRPLVVGELGQPVFGERGVAGGVLQPAAGVDAGDHPAQVDALGDRGVVDEDVQQRPADVLRFESRVEVQHDPAWPAGPAELVQLRQEVLAQRAGQAAVGELEHRLIVAVGVAQPPVHASGPDVAQVVVQHGDVRVERPDPGDHGLDTRRVQPAEHQ